MPQRLFLPPAAVLLCHYTWDSEADVWIATNNDIPGLVLESGSFDALLERTRFAVPELNRVTVLKFEILNACDKQGVHKEKSRRPAQSNRHDISLYIMCILLSNFYSSYHVPSLQNCVRTFIKN